MKINLHSRGKKKFYLMAVMLLSMGMSYAQKNVTVKGTIRGEGDKLPILGANVIVKGTSKGTISDFDGNYAIIAAPGQQITISYLGYIARTIKVPKINKTIDVTLGKDATELDEVVVVGYGTQRKKEVTGAVVKVTSEVIEQTATADLGTALQGQIAGVNVTSSGGDPGAESNIQIRGLTSISGANNPLYVVDGIPYASNPKLSMNEIESVDVLKDAASAAIYGTRGAAGVILITTKKSKQGVMKISLDSYYGVQKIITASHIMNTKDYLYTKFVSAAALNNTHYGNTWTQIDQNPKQLTNNTNLFNLIENNLAPVQNHNLRISGGSNGLSYNINGSFFSQDGVIVKSKYKRFNIRANTQYKKGKWTIDTGMSSRIEYKKSPPYGLIQNAISYAPYSNALTLDGKPIANAGTGSSASNISYLGYRLLQTDNKEGDYFDGRLSARYNINKNLNFTARGSASFDNGTQVVINPSFIAYNNLGEEVPSQKSKITNISTLAKKTTAEAILDYKKSFGNHNFNFTAVYSAEKYTYSQFTAAKYDIFNNNITVINGGTGDTYSESGTNQWTQNRVNTLIGSLARVQYNYKGKYIASASVRRDGSSRFQKQHFGYFPSFSLGWNVSDENFWKPIKKVVSNFKLRASRGTTGNQGIPDYSYSPVITLQQDYVLGNGASQNLQTGAMQTGYANPDVKWETSVSTNTGLDISFLKNKLTASVDYYVTDKNNMLFPVVLPPSTGAGLGSQVTLNTGNMTNSGVEFAVKYRHYGKFSWNGGLTFSKNKNIITKMSGSNNIIYFNGSTITGNNNDQDLTTAVAVGHQAGAFFLMKTDGTIKNNKELIEYQKLVSGAKLGDLRYLDTNGDGKIDTKDRTDVGSGTPKFVMGLNFGANYKKFDLTMQIYGSYGAKILNGNKAMAYKSATSQDLVYQWTPANNTSNVPVNRGATHNNYRGYSDYWMEDGSYVRLRNISLGYTFDKTKIEKFGLKKLRLYVAGQNLLTLTKYTGYNPEVGGNGLSTKGIDKGTYPISAQIRAGLQLDF